MSSMTIREFARAAGVETNYLSVYIRRGKVVVIDGLIDPDHPLNMAFKFSRKGKNLELNLSDLKRSLLMRLRKPESLGSVPLDDVQQFMVDALVDLCEIVRKRELGQCRRNASKPEKIVAFYREVLEATAIYIFQQLNKRSILGGGDHDE